MKSKAVMKPKSLLIACCASTALAFLIGVVDDAYAQRGGRGGGGFSRGGAASSGSFSDSAAGPAGAGAGGQAGVGGGAAGQAGAGRAGVGGQAGVGGGAAGAAGVGDAARWDNAAARTTTVAVLPCSATVTTVNGVTYYSCGTTYYTQSYSGGSVEYVPSAPPGH